MFVKSSNRLRCQYELQFERFNLHGLGDLLWKFVFRHLFELIAVLYVELVNIVVQSAGIGDDHEYLFCEFDDESMSIGEWLCLGRNYV